MMVRISVIIPAYNAEKTIKETIESVLKQTFADWELIIINDGSTDSTLDIVNGFQDGRIQVFSYPNSGASASRNKGFSHSQGEYIALLDADDLWSTDKLEAQLAALETNPQASIAYSWSDCIDESSQFLRRGGHLTINGDAFPQLLLLDILENGSNPLIRRKAFAAIDGFDESLPAGQDWDLYLRLAAAGYQFVAIPRTQVFYRISTSSMSANVLRLESASVKVIDRAFQGAPLALQHLKADSLGNLYKYLTFKALEETVGKERNLAAARFLVAAIANDSSLLRTRVLVKALLKITIMLLLPSSLAAQLLKKMKRICDTTTLLGYLKLDAYQSNQ